MVWAGTSQGLFVHRLQAFPSIPSYSGADLSGKAALTLLVCLLVTPILVYQHQAMRLARRD